MGNFLTTKKASYNIPNPPTSKCVPFIGTDGVLHIKDEFGNVTNVTTNLLNLTISPPLTGGFTSSIGMTQATTSVDGYLKATDMVTLSKLKNYKTVTASISSPVTGTAGLTGNNPLNISNAVAGSVYEFYMVYNKTVSSGTGITSPASYFFWSASGNPGLASSTNLWSGSGSTTTGTGLGAMAIKAVLTILDPITAGSMTITSYYYDPSSLFTISTVGECFTNTFSSVFPASTPYVFVDYEYASGPTSINLQTYFARQIK